MACRFLLLILILNINFLYGNIIYDKNEITITEIELIDYIEIYNNNFNLSLSENSALKKIVLMKKTINFFEKNNPKFIELIDENLKVQFGDSYKVNAMNRDFLRFLKIRNEFISEYFSNKFNYDDFKIILLSIKELKVPISKNGCLTIDRIENLKDNLKFQNNLYENIIDNSKVFKLELENNIYDVCLNSTLYKKIEELIIRYIENKTENDFNKFIYSKLS